MSTIFEYSKFQTFWIKRLQTRNFDLRTPSIPLPFPSHLISTERGWVEWHWEPGHVHAYASAKGTTATIFHITRLFKSNKIPKITILPLVFYNGSYSALINPKSHFGSEMYCAKHS